MIIPFVFVENKYEEIFMPLECYDVRRDTYEIGTKGTVREINTKRVLPMHGSNYNEVYLKRENETRGKSYLVHRLLGETYIPRLREEQNIINHKDCVKRNNDHANLEWCTITENTLHSISMGMHNPRGESNPTSRLTNYIVHEICKLMEQNMQYSKILVMVGLETSKQNLDILTKIRTGKLWSHISNDYDIPETEYRTPMIIYSDERINNMCQLLELGKSTREIAEILDIDISNKNKIDKFWHFIRRLKNRISFTEISKHYNF